MSWPRYVFEVTFINPLEDPFDVVAVQFERDQLTEALAFYDALAWSSYRSFWGVIYWDETYASYQRVYGWGELPSLRDAPEPMKYLSMPRPVRKAYKE